MIRRTTARCSEPGRVARFPPDPSLGARALTLCAGLLLFVAPAFLHAQEMQVAQESFRGKTQAPADFYLIGQNAKACVFFEPAGMRIALPKGVMGARPGTGVQTRFGLRGDFEIAVSYEISGEPEPKEAGPETRITLAVSLDRAKPWLHQVKISRQVAESGPQFLASMTLHDFEDPGKGRKKHEPFRATAKAGRLKMVRVGDKVAYFVAEGMDAPFEKLTEIPFTSEDVRHVSIVGSTGGENAALEFRITDFQAKAAAILRDLPPEKKLPSQAPANPDDRKYAKEMYFDFRGKPLPEEMAPAGKEMEAFIRSEPQGLRVTLPADRPNLGPVGVATKFGVQGDFDITATVEILHADMPERGFGVGAMLYVNKVEPPTEGTNIGRLMRVEGDQLMWDRRFERPGQKPTFNGGNQPCSDKIVRLRLVRTGSQLLYLWAPGTSGGEFRRIAPAQEFGRDEIKQVTLRATSGQQPLRADVRWLDLRIKSGGVLATIDPAAASPTAPTPQTPDGGPQPSQGSSIWLIAVLAGGLIFGLLAVLALAGWLVISKRAKSAGISFPCPKCERTLNVPADMAGKKIRCKACGAVAMAKKIGNG